MARWRSAQIARNIFPSRQARARAADRICQLALGFAITIGTLTCGVQAQKFDHAKLAERARQSFIIPGYARLNTEIAHLGSAINTVCHTPSPGNLLSARDAYRRTIAAWSRIEIIRFGPVAQENRLERLFFWPDRKGIGARQIRRLLSGENRDSLVPGKLATKSVAVQGMTALELLLHGSGGEDLATSQPNTFRCRFAQSVADNLAGMTREILASWSDSGAFTKLWKSPGPDNPIYLNPSETSLELIKAFDQALSVARDRRIVPAIGLGPKRRIFRPVLWRSGLGMILIHGNIAGARDLFAIGGLADAYLASKQQADPSATSVIDSIKTEFKLLLQATAELAAMPSPFEQKETRSRLIATGFPLKSIRQRVVSRVKSAAGLSIGFNASDGD